MQTHHWNASPPATGHFAQAFMKILIIEDEAKTEQFLRRGLRETGLTVDGVSHGSDGLHLALTERITTCSCSMSCCPDWTAGRSFGNCAGRTGTCPT